MTQHVFSHSISNQGFLIKTKNSCGPKLPELTKMVKMSPSKLMFWLYLRCVEVEVNCTGFEQFEYFVKVRHMTISSNQV